jgi:hypothetical protein
MEVMHHQTYEDWYKVKTKDINNSAMYKLLGSRYNGSLATALMHVYPQFECQPWRFAGGVPKGMWKNLDFQKRYFEWLSEGTWTNRMFRTEFIQRTQHTEFG